MRKNIAMDQLMCEAYRKENAEEYYGLSKDGVDDLIYMVEEYIEQYEAAQARISELDNDRMDQRHKVDVLCARISELEKQVAMTSPREGKE